MKSVLLIGKYGEASDKRDDYFPNSNLILRGSSMLELIFASPIASKAVINSDTNEGVWSVYYWKRIGIDLETFWNFISNIFPDVINLKISIMNKNLVMYAFAKAKQEIKKTGVKNPSLTQIATVLSDYLEEKGGIVLGEKSLRVYRGEALKLLNEEDDLSIKQLMVIKGLCKYLGYDTYQDFINNTTSKKAETKLLPNKKRVKFSQAFKIVAIAAVIGVLSLLMYNYTHRQRWMVWQQNHYIEVDFDAKKYGVNQLKLYKEDRISSFKKVDVTCDTIFFNDDGSPRFWYGKNRKKQLEFFTDLGLHPETGKTLKPITGYMIEKYVCVEKNKFID